MAKKVTKQIDPAEIDAKALALIKLIKRNEERKPEDQVDHSVTVVHDKKNAIMVCGSAHELEGLLVEMLEKRPELRQVLENAIYRYGQKANW